MLAVVPTSPALLRPCLGLNRRHHLRLHNALAVYIPATVEPFHNQPVFVEAPGSPTNTGIKTDLPAPMTVRASRILTLKLGRDVQALPPTPRALRKLVRSSLYASSTNLCH